MPTRAPSRSASRETPTRTERGPGTRASLSASVSPSGRQTTKGQPRSSGSARRRAATEKRGTTAQAKRGTAPLEGLAEPNSGAATLGRRHGSQSAMPCEIDARLQPLEQRRRSGCSLPHGLYRRELETHSGRRTGKPPPPLRAGTRCPLGPRKNHQCRLRPHRGTRKAKPGLGRGEHPAPFLRLRSWAGSLSSETTPWGPSPLGTLLVQSLRRIEQDQGEASGGQKNLGRRERRDEARRTNPEKPVERNSSRTRTCRIESVRHVDPSGKVLLCRGLGQYTLDETGDPDRALPDQLGEPPSGQASPQEVVDLWVPRGKTSALPLQPLLPRGRRHVTTPDGPRELGKKIFDAKLGGALHLPIFAFCSPLGQGA